MSTATPKSVRFSRFDRVVWVVVVAALLAIVFLVWRGDTVGLKVVDFSPAENDPGASTRAGIAVRFDAPLGDVQGANTITLEPPVTGSVRATGDQLVFTPETALAPGADYTVRVAPGVRSTEGRTLDQPVTWRFRTRQVQALYSGVQEGVEQLLVASFPNRDSDQQVGGVEPNQLTKLPSGVWDFTVAPDGGEIVFSSATPEGTSDLWHLAPGVTEPVRLVACPKAFCSNPEISPNGRLLLYSQRNANDYAAAAVSPPRLYIMDLATKESAKVFADDQKLAFDARWSPDGKWITYLSPDYAGIGVSNLDNGQNAIYPTTTGETGIWSPRDNVFLMSRMLEVGGTQVVHLFLIDPIANTEIDISGSESLVQDGAPAWSPDGEWIVFRRNELTGERQSLSKQLWLMRADGSDARPLTTDPAVDHGAASWSPDGKFLLYHSFPLKGPNVVISIWAMDVATGEQWQVVSPGQRPQWLP